MNAKMTGVMPSAILLLIAQAMYGNTGTRYCWQTEEPCRLPSLIVEGTLTPFSHVSLARFANEEGWKGTPDLILKVSDEGDSSFWTLSVNGKEVGKGKWKSHNEEAGKSGIVKIISTIMSYERSEDAPEAVEEKEATNEYHHDPGAPKIEGRISNEYHHEPGAPKIEGRISDDDLKAVMVGFDEEAHRVLPIPSQDAADITVLAHALRACQKTFHGSSENAQRVLSQDISGLEKRLGKFEQPQSDDDLMEMVEMFRRCVSVAQDEHAAQRLQSRDERGNLYNARQNSTDFQKLILSASAADVSNKIQRDVDSERAQRLLIDKQRTAVISVEQALDKGDLPAANRQYQQMASDSSKGQVVLQILPKEPSYGQDGGLHLYLQRTESLRQDLAAFEQVTKIDRRRDIALVRQLQNVKHETDLLNAAASEPLTRTYLQSAHQADTEVLRQRLASLPAFQFDEASYKIPHALAETTLSNLREKLGFVSGQISDIDRKLSSASELLGVVAQPEALKTLENELGPVDANALKQKAVQIPSAERVRASLAAEQQSLQAAEARVEAKLAVEKQEAAAKIAAEQHSRQLVKAKVAAEQQEAAALHLKPTIEYHGLILGQYIHKNQPPKTDCLSEDVAYIPHYAAMGGEDHNEDNPTEARMAQAQSVQARLSQEFADFKAGRRSSHCFWESDHLSKSESSDVSRITRITVETRETPKDAIAKFSQFYGPPTGFLSSEGAVDTIWQWKDGNRSIAVVPIEARDPQTLERFAITKIMYQAH